MRQNNEDIEAYLTNLQKAFREAKESDTGGGFDRTYGLVSAAFHQARRMAESGDRAAAIVIAGTETTALLREVEQALPLENTAGRLACSKLAATQLAEAAKLREETVGTTRLFEKAAGITPVEQPPQKAAARVQPFVPSETLFREDAGRHTGREPYGCKLPLKCLISAVMKEAVKKADPKKGDYSAADIEVLEGLEPVRKRPGMYIGGTDAGAMHHLVSEILDNAMDEAVAEHATRITIDLQPGNRVTISDNGRGIPVDNHPKFPGKSAMEVIFTTLHSGGKFSGKVYNTSGGLHGVGSSVVNALSSEMTVKVAREKELFEQKYSRGKATGRLKKLGATKERGTTVSFVPDTEIFGDKADFSPKTIYKLARSKAYLYRGVEIQWTCAAELLKGVEGVPAEDIIKFPNGILDYLYSLVEGKTSLTPKPFYGSVEFPDGEGRCEFAIAWTEEEQEGFLSSYCNTIPTPEGGTHVQGLRAALSKGLKSYAERIGNKKAGILTPDDIFNSATALLSIFIREPQFQGQTKDKLTTLHATRLVENATKDNFEHWLTSDNNASKYLLDYLIQLAEDRRRAKESQETSRKSATRKLRLPGKLSDCSKKSSDNTEIFIVEGDSAGGSAKQARNRELQAILPLRGKVLNVASATADKIRQNTEISDLIQALGCGVGKDFNLDKLRYERVIIMTDADVDGAHIASLLITLFYQEMKGLIEHGALYLALPPLYRLSAGGDSVYARDDAHKEELLKTVFKGKKKVEMSRFKGLGEMPAAQLKETTMDMKKRSLLRVVLPEAESSTDAFVKASGGTAQLIERLMGKNPEARFEFIQENAQFVADIDI